MTDSTKTQEILVGPDLLDTFHEMQFWLGEDEALFKSLQEETLADLGQGGPYQRSLVENIIQLEWETRRMKTMRASLIADGMKRQAADAFYMAEVGLEDVLGNNHEALKFADDLFHSDPERHVPAQEKLATMGIKDQDLQARAYCAIVLQLEYFDRQIAEAEPRRRRLRDDLERVKAEAAKTIGNILELEQDTW